jgi:hypothetical protein
MHHSNDHLGAHCHRSSYPPQFGFVGGNMAVAVSDICDTLGISFVQDRHGWSDVIIQHAGDVISCRVSGVFSNASLELMKLCRAILENLPEAILLLDEPGGHRLSVAPDLEQQHLIHFNVFRFESAKNNSTSIFSIQTKRKQLLALFMTELWKLYQFHTEPSFTRGRSPFSEADALVNLNAEWDAHPRLGPSFLK